jgi:hypothetical protein
VTREQELLRALQAVLTSADVDVSELVEGAWDDAQETVRATLRRMMTQDLLARALATLEDPSGAATTTTAPSSTGEVATAPHPVPPAPPADEDASPDGPAAPTPPQQGVSTYLFGVVGPDAHLPVTELPRLPGGGPLRLLPIGRAQALVCDVDPATFESLREPGPAGLDLLAAAAHAHDAVLARFVDAPVLPLPLGTVVNDDAAVTDLLGRHADGLRAELDRLSGTAEWAVTVRSLEDPSTEDTPTPASGRDYLEARRAARSRREGRWADQERLAADLHGPLAACAIDAEQVASRPLEEAAPPLMHGVYLVADDARDRFASTVAYLRTEHPGTIIEATGPWPPYHFAALDLSNDSESAS